MIYVFFNFVIHFVAVLPSVGIGALSAREAEGRINTSAGEKVFHCSTAFFHLNLSEAV